MAANNATARAFVSRFAASNRQVLLDGAAQVEDSLETPAAPLWRVTAHLPGITACGDCSPRQLFFRAKEAAAEFGDPKWEFRGGRGWCIGRLSIDWCIN